MAIHSQLTPCGPAGRALALLACLGLLSGQAPAAPEGSDPFFGDGGTSDFYRWVGPALTKPGVMLRQEPVGEGFYADHASLAQRILYSSTDGRFNRGVVEASGLIYLPKGQVPKGGWPLVVWGHGTLGIADVCAPSWHKPNERDGTFVDKWLQAGFAVVAPDYQGLGTPGVHPYLQRKPEGYSVLDAARAAIAAYPGKIANRVILTGQSQGSGAVLNATSVAKTYAPDVRLMGTIATALLWRAADKAEPARDVMVPDAARYAIMRLASGGYRPGSPPLDQVLSAKGKALAAAAAKGCSRDLVPVLAQEGIDGPNAFTIPPAQVAAMFSSIAAPRQNLGVPLLIATGKSDRTIDTRAQSAAVQAMCRYGNRIEWRTYAGIGHSATSHASLVDAIPFARALLAGRKTANDCGHIVPLGPPTKADMSIPFND